VKQPLAKLGPSDRYLTPYEGARELGNCAAGTIQLWCRQGKFQGAVCLPGRMGWRIPRSSWEKFKKSLS